MKTHASRIIGTGSAFPSGRLTNTELSARVETSPEWIVERTGIQERRISDPSNTSESLAGLSHLASVRALEMAGITALDVDLILCATFTPDQIIPSAACSIQQKLGASRAWAMDLNAACTGFVYAATTADAFIRSGQARTVLVVGADVMSRCTDWQDRATCILFGDGAGAAIFQRTDSESPHRILGGRMGSDATHADFLEIPQGGRAMRMKGREIFKVAVRTLAETAEQTLADHGISAEHLDWIVPHQANQRIIEAVAKRLEFPMSRVVVTIHQFGNTSAATVPTALDEAVRDGRIQRGHTVLLNAFGAGLTYGSLLLRW